MPKIFITEKIDHSDEGWDEFKKWLDGTYASLPYTWVDEGRAYQIIIADGLIYRSFSINKTDATDFENNYKIKESQYMISRESTLYDAYQAILNSGSQGEVTQNILLDSYNVLVNIDGTDFATEATLYDSYEILRRIKDVDGIQKIDEALPIGDNIIGRVKVTDGYQVLQVSDGGEGRIVLYDDVNNLPMAATTGSDITNKSGLMVLGRHVNDDGLNYDGYFLHVKNDLDTNAHKRLLVESSIKPGSVIAITTQTASASSLSEFLTNATYNEDMVQDGSGTPISYRYSADPTYNIILSSLRLVISANAFTFNGSSFGKGGGILTNGVQINYVANDGDISKTISILTINEDFWRLLDFVIHGQVMTASAKFGSGIKLIAGSSDYVEVIVRDNLTLGSQDIYYFTATLYSDIEDV